MERAEPEMQITALKSFFSFEQKFASNVGVQERT